MFSKEDENKLYQAAISLFEGDKESAKQWLNSPCSGLGEVSPLDYAVDDKTLQVVLALIGGLEHGVF